MSNIFKPKQQTSTTQTTSSTQPWGPQQPYLQQLFGGAQQQYQQGPMQYYPGQQIASQSPQTQQALSGITERAQAGSDLTRAGQGEFQKTIAGDYLNPQSNPYLQQNLDLLTGQVRGGVAGTFGTRGGNNYGSSAHEEWLTNKIAENASPLLNQNYQAERARQLNAAQLAPQMANADYTDLGMLQGVGQTQDAYQQSLIEAEKNKFAFNQQAPWDLLQRYQSAISGPYGGTSAGTSTEPYYSGSMFNNLLGLGLGGVGLYGMGKGAGLWGTAGG